MRCCAASERSHKLVSDSAHHRHHAALAPRARRGPVGEATEKAVQAAAKLTVQATKEVTKVAVPVGAWALSEGAKLAWAAMRPRTEPGGTEERKKQKK